MTFIKTINHNLTYSQDPSLWFYTLCHNQANRLLLESAEIGSKNACNSLLVASSAVKISARGELVTYQALNHNGNSLLTAFLPYLESYIANYKSSSRIVYQLDQTSALAEIQLTIQGVNHSLSEDQKLYDLSSLTGLQAIQEFLAINQETAVTVAGLFSYDLILQFIEFNGELSDHLNCPDYLFYVADQLIHLDHQTTQAKLTSFAFSEQSYPELLAQAAQIVKQLQDPILELPKVAVQAPQVTLDIDDQQFKELILQLKEHLYAGDIFQIVPSRCFKVVCDDPLRSYSKLKQSNPSPYMFYIQDQDFILFGASPESALKFNPEDRQVEVYPIAGSRPRGFKSDGTIDPEFDARMELDLRLDQKEQTEHLMLVDLARNDISRISETQTRRVVDFMKVDKYSHIMHLVSRVVGTLKANLNAFHAYQATMNMGTLTGSPKVKAMQLLYQYQKQKRAYYGGAVGYFTSQGLFDTAIVIRSAYIKDNFAYVSAGAGCVLDSVPQLEADETRHKAKAVLNAITQVQQGK